MKASNDRINLILKSGRYFGDQTIVGWMNNHDLITAEVFSILNEWEQMAIVHPAYDGLFPEVASGLGYKIDAIIRSFQSLDRYERGALSKRSLLSGGSMRVKKYKKIFFSLSFLRCFSFWQNEPTCHYPLQLLVD